jgi:hypothetical protein
MFRQKGQRTSSMLISGELLGLGVPEPIVSEARKQYEAEKTEQQKTKKRSGPER